MEENRNENGIALVGLILSFFFGLIGFIVSIIGLKRSKELNGQGKGFAIVGIIIGLLHMLFWIIPIIVMIILFSFPDKYIDMPVEPIYHDTITNITYKSIEVYDEVKEYIIANKDELNFVYTNIKNNNVETRNITSEEKDNLIKNLNEVEPAGLVSKRDFELVDDITINYLLEEENITFKILLYSDKTYIQIINADDNYVYRLDRMILNSAPIIYN